jgi:hypothetical protein
MNQPITFRTLIIANGLTVLLFVAFLLVSGTAAHPLLQANTASTQTTTISYQGHLTDNAGEPVNSDLPMTFTLYDAPTGGTAVWTEERSGSNAVPVTAGLFSVSLGSVTPLDNTLFGEPLWLGISVNGDAEMTPREQLDGGATAVVPRLLGEDSCTRHEGCPHPTETTHGGWNPVKGTDVNDMIEVTVTTSGRPLLVTMTARGGVKPVGNVVCNVEISQNGERQQLIQLDRMAGGPDYFEKFGCSGSYVVTDLPAGVYTFRAGVHTSDADSVEVTWAWDRQIAVIEF